jgi:HD superfamily phosphohydrolase
MDTVEFQKLARIKQLALSYHVYPSAVHTRKEHSIGVMHLTGVVVDQLRNFVEISNREKELLQLAGLYHDVGHTAYSHMFDDFLENYHLQCKGFFSMKDHEHRSIFILKIVNEKLNNPLTLEELKFVENVILGNINNDNKAYLYQIVNNKSCGIDTDKMDYLYRDAYHTGMAKFQPSYIIHNMVVDTFSSEIMFKSKSKEDIKDLFDTRTRMFKQVYKHHTVEKINQIYKCAMKSIDPQKLFQYDIMTDDMNIETLLRSEEASRKIIEQVDLRNFNHKCPLCVNHHITIKESGNISSVKFLNE